MLKQLDPDSGLFELLRQHIADTAAADDRCGSDTVDILKNCAARRSSAGPVPMNTTLSPVSMVVEPLGMNN